MAALCWYDVSPHLPGEMDVALRLQDPHMHRICTFQYIFVEGFACKICCAMQFGHAQHFEHDDPDEGHGESQESDHEESH